MPLPGGSSEAQSWGCAVRDRVGAGGPGGGDRGTEPGLCPVDGAASGRAGYSLLWPRVPRSQELQSAGFLPRSSRNAKHPVFPCALIRPALPHGPTLTVADEGD